MNERNRRIIKRVAVVITCIYLAGGLVIYFLQDRLLFHPTALPPSYVFSFDDPFREMNIPFGKENLSMLSFPSAEEHRGIVLFFHGNAENVQHYKQYPFLFTRSGYEVWMPDYPGFGKSTGPRSEKTMEEQALLVYQLALKKFPADSIILYGKSMGTGVASWLAAHYPCRQLILETPYYSIPSLARHYVPFYPGFFMSRYSFPVHSYLQKASCPVTIIHGTKDELIPFSQSRRLASENNHTHLLYIGSGEHNNLISYPLFQQYIDSLLAD